MEQNITHHLNLIFVFYLLFQMSDYHPLCTPPLININY
jgi:hypothetical protein